MPAPGDQHTAVANPFEEPQQRISEYTAKEIATLQSRLEKQLGPEYISSRSGPGGSKVAYISADKCIGLANEVFGFNGWSSSLQNIQVDFVDKQDGKWHVGLSVIVRVTLRDGTYHEDIGYGQMENTKKAAAFEKAKKEGTTDALKRALRNFGNVLGNCLYDKTYLSNVAKVKAVPTKFDETRLHRHPDLAAQMAKEQKTVPSRPPPQLLAADSFEDFYGDLDEAELDYAGFDDEVVLPPSNETDSKQSNTSNKIQNLPNGGNGPVQPPRQFARASSAGNPPRQPPQTPAQQPARPLTNNFPGAGAGAGVGPPNCGPPAVRPPQQQFNQNRPPVPQPKPPNQNQNQPPQMTPPQPTTTTTSNAFPAAAAPAGVGGDAPSFFSARAVPKEGIPEEQEKSKVFTPKPGHVFNPRFEGASIPRTPGVDHSASKPLAKSGKHVAPVTVKGDEEEIPLGTQVGGGLNGGVGAGALLGGAQSGNGASAGAGRGVAAGRMGAAGGTGNVVNPQLDQTRRIGAPAAGGLSPLANRGQFRPLTVKRPAGTDGQAVNGNGNGFADRVPLGDKPSNAVVVGGVGAKMGEGVGPDLKRQRTS